jgi:hypothetical protein
MAHPQLARQGTNERIADKAVTSDEKLTRKRTHSINEDVQQEIINSLQMKLQQKEEDLDELRKNLNNVNKRLLKFSQGADPMKLDDAHFHQSFSMLVYKIFNWTSKYFSCQQASQRFIRRKAPYEDDFDSLHPDWKKLVASDRSRPLIIEMYIWRALCDLVFELSSETGALWAEDIRREIRTLNAEVSYNCNRMYLSYPLK